MKKTLITLAALAVAFSGVAVADTTLGFTAAPTATQANPIIPTGFTFTFELTQEYVDSMEGNTALAAFGASDNFCNGQGVNMFTLEQKDGGYVLMAGTTSGGTGHNTNLSWDEGADAPTKVYYEVSAAGCYSSSSALTLNVGGVYTLTGVIDSNAQMTVTMTNESGDTLATLNPYNAKTNGADISKFVVRTNALVTPVADTPAVPEPATATLSLLALAGLASRRRRK